MAKSIQLVSLLIALAASANALWVGAAEPAAIVTDLHGEVRLGSGGNVSLLAELPVGVEVQLQPAARMVLIHIDSQTSYELTGPATFGIRAGGVQSLAGARAATVKSLPAGFKDVRLRPARIAQAGISMRGESTDERLRIVTPVATWLLEPPAMLRWASLVPATSYAVQLTDSENRVVFDAATASTEVALPPHVRLEPGRLYGWQVKTALADGQSLEAWAEFGVADQALRARIEAVRPGPDAGDADRIAFALLLEALNVREAARAEWAKAARGHPGDLRLRALAEGH